MHDASNCYNWMNRWLSDYVLEWLQSLLLYLDRDCCHSTFNLCPNHDSVPRKVNCWIESMGHVQSWMWSWTSSLWFCFCRLSTSYAVRARNKENSVTGVPTFGERCTVLLCYWRAQPHACARCQIFCPALTRHQASKAMPCHHAGQSSGRSTIMVTMWSVPAALDSWFARQALAYTQQSPSSCLL